MSSDTDGNGPSSGPGTSDSSSKQNSLARVGISVVIVIGVGGLLLLWMMFANSNKKPEDTLVSSKSPLAMLNDRSFQPRRDPAEHPFTEPPQVLNPTSAKPRTFFVLAPTTSTISEKPTTREIPQDYVPPIRTGFPEKLPSHVVPLHYDLMFKVILNANKEQNLMYGDTYYLGKAIILVNCQRPTRTLYMHAMGFTIKEHQTTLVKEDDKTFIGIGRMAVNDDLQMLKIELETGLQEDHNYTLSLEYAGTIGTMPRGIFKTTSVTNNQKITVVGTQFKPTYARRSFPCFDEPALKASFDIVIVRPKAYRSFSNMAPARSEDRSRDFVADYYERSPPMSTHMLAFVVGPYVTAGSGVIKVHGTSEQLQSCEYVLQMAPTIFSYFQDVLRINYPLPKLDLVALSNLPAAAVEQWGIITFQSAYLMYNKDETPFQLKLDSLKLLALKIAQQWVGNLVTFAWWDHMWMKEGLSHYLQYSAAGSADPQSDAVSTMVVTEVHNAMENDGYNTSQPVSLALNTPLQILRHLSPFTQAKSFSLIRMMAHLLPRNSFKLALTEFLKRYSYKTVQPEHLFKELHEVQQSLFGRLMINMTSVMHNWITKPGFPVVFLNRSYSERTATVSQKRFIYGSGPVDNTLWQIPVSYVTEENPDFEATTPKRWLRSRDAPLLEMPPKNRWVILNVLETNYYKVNYDKTNWLLIISQLESDHQVIHEYNRAQLIDDALDLARAGQLQYDLAFDVLEYLPKERHHVPWNSAITNFRKLDPVLRHTKVYSKWMKFVNHLLSNQYERIMAEEHRDESMQISILRTSILAFSCDYDHAPCVMFCKKMFENLKVNYDNTFHLLPHSYRPIVFCQAIKHGNEADFNFLWKHYEATTLPKDSAVLLKALSCTTNLKLLEKLLLQLVNKNSGVETTQKAANLLNAISSTSLSGSTSVVRFMSDHQEAVYSRYGTLQGLFDSILQSIVDNIQHERELAKLHEIYERTRDVLPSEEEKVLRMISNAREHIRWSSHYYRDVESWLEKRYFLDHQETNH